MNLHFKLAVCVLLMNTSLGVMAMHPEENRLKPVLYKNSGDTVYRPFQISFVPYFGTNGMHADSAITDLSINILAGYVYEVRSAEFGGLVNIVRRNVSSCQIAGLGNVVLGKAKGFQGAGTINIANTMEGVQVAGIINTTRNLSGIQIAGCVNNALKGSGSQMSGLVNNAGESSEFQIAGLANNAPVAKLFQISGLLNNASRETGFQIAGLANNAKQADQFQIAGLVNNTRDTTNFQISGLVNNAPAIKSCQIAGLLNNSNEVTGVQLAGLVNRAKVVKGMQIGFINIADSCSGLPIGILNFVKNGYHKLELSTDEVFYANIAFRSGVQKFHGIITAGIQPDNFDQPLWTYGVGAGTSVKLSSRMLVDMDAIFQHIIVSNKVGNNYMYKFYVGADWQVFPKASLCFGITYNFLVTDSKDTHYQEFYSDISPYAFTDHSYRYFNLKTWAGFKVGIRFL